jgi:DnaJ-domain-containing protein 1
MATAFLAFAISRLICRRPLYGALARRFLHAQHHAAAADELVEVSAGEEPAAR